MKHKPHLRGLPVIRQALARRIRKFGIRAAARETGIPVATVGDRVQDPKGISFHECQAFAKLLGAELQLVIYDVDKWHQVGPLDLVKA